jgi:hypothetical protein
MNGEPSDSTSQLFSFLPSSIFTRLSLFMLFVSFAAVSGCVARNESRVEQILPKLTNMNDARMFFGSPGASETQDDGTIRHEWRLNASYDVQGQYVTEQSPWGKHDDGGYPVVVDREVWRRGHSVTKQCTLVILSDPQGKVLFTKAEGDSCDDLLIRSAGQNSNPSLQ